MKPAGRVRMRNMAGYSAGGGKEKSPGQWWPGLKIAEYPAPEARGAQSISNDGHPPSAARLRSSVTARAALASAENARALVSACCRDITKPLSVP
jgi:hypothetical protein